MNDAPKNKSQESIVYLKEISKKNIEQIAKLEATTRQKSSKIDRVTDFIAAYCGSMTFVYMHVVWFGGWIICNSSLVPDRFHFDPYPYQFLTLVVSLEAIFLSTFVLISQNRQARISERRNHLDLQVNLLAEQENSKMLYMLEAIHHKLDISFEDPEIEDLEKAMDPYRLAEQIDAIMEKP